MGIGSWQPMNQGISSDEVTAVLFDLDDTLIDSARGRAVAEAVVSRMLWDHLDTLGLCVTRENLLSKLGCLARRMNRRGLYDRSLWWQLLVDELDSGVTLPEARISDVTRMYWSCFHDWSRPFPDTTSALEALLVKGYLLGLVTDTDGTAGVKNQRVSLLSFRRAFNVVVIAGEDTPETKPDVAPFKLAASRLGLSCAECVFVGDKPSTDIVGAKRAGMKSVLLTRGTRRSHEQADFTASSLSEICRIL